MAANQTVRFQYPVGRDYRRIPVTGVIGGPTPNGLVVAHLFVETHRLPAEQTGVILPDGQLQMPQASPPEPVIDRELMVGLMMTPEATLSIGQWLVNTANAAITARATQQSPSKPN